MFHQWRSPQKQNNRKNQVIVGGLAAFHNVTHISLMLRLVPISFFSLACFFFCITFCVTPLWQRFMVEVRRTASCARNVDWMCESEGRDLVSWVNTSSWMAQSEFTRVLKPERWSNYHQLPQQLTADLCPVSFKLKSSRIAVQTSSSANLLDMLFIKPQHQSEKQEWSGHWSVGVQRYLCA